MATMCPKSLDGIKNRPVPPSEKIVFEKLKQLHNDIIVVWSVSWTERRSDKEADFVIIDPRWPSILVLEVKGGKISLEERQWYSTNRKGQKREIVDPVEQAKQGQYKIVDRIERSLRQNLDFTFGWGVVFPDIECPENMETEGPSMIPRVRVIDINDLENPVDAIDRVFKDFNSGSTPSTEPSPENRKFAEGALDVISPTLDFVHPISWYMKENKETWVQLDRFQKWILGTLEANKRGLIYGAAGTGKTIIAQYAADNAAKNDKKVLYLCFNAPLAAAIYSGVKRENKKYSVYTYNSLCTIICDYTNPDADAVLLALGKRRSRIAEDFYWDVVIIDEGQDFKKDSWSVLERLVRDDGSLYVFYDPYQAIAGGLDDSIIPIVQEKEDFKNSKYPLSDNYRNTVKIGGVANDLIKEDAGVPVPSLDMAPEGAPVKYMSPTQINGMGRLVENEVETWIRGGILKNGIAVLTANHIYSCQGSYKNISELCKRGILHNGYKKDELAQDRPTLISIERFKGLEADAVVLVVPTNSEEEYWKMHYVGVSRARQFLTVVKAPLDPISFMDHLKSELKRLVENMTDEQIEECSNVQGNGDTDDTREIPVDIRTTILAKMKTLNNKEECEQGNSNKRSAFKLFWEIFLNRDSDLLKCLIENMENDQIEKCCDIPLSEDSRKREIPEEIRMKIDNTINESNESFWEIFDKANYEKVLESELKRLVKEMEDGQIKEFCDVPVDKRIERNFFRTGHKKEIWNRVNKVENLLNRNDLKKSKYENARKSFWEIFDKANYEKVLESELKRLVQNMTYEQIEKWHNVVQGHDGTREIPEEIDTMILAKMKALNDKEEQDHSDKVFAFESFWTLFDMRLDFLNNLESELERLVQEMTYGQIKKCCNAQGHDGTREIPEEIDTMILAKMKALNDKEEQDHSDKAFAFKSFWTLFNTRLDFLNNLESELERLVQEMTYGQIEKCYNVQGHDGTREIPEEIDTMILAKMKALNGEEEQDHSDKVFAFESFWTLFDMRFSDFMNNMKKLIPQGLTLVLENLMKEMTYKEYRKMNNVQAEEDGARNISKEFLKKMKIGSVLNDKKNKQNNKENKQIVSEYFWTIFDNNKPRIDTKLYYIMRKRLR